MQDFWQQSALVMQMPLSWRRIRQLTFLGTDDRVHASGGSGLTCFFAAEFHGSVLGHGDEGAA